MADKNVYVIIPAAGKSVRMGGPVPKILMEVAGVPVVIRTLQAFEPFNMKAVVVTGDTLISEVEELIKKFGITCVVAVIKGGASRTESVACGVEYLKDICSSDDIVFVHDGARCLVNSTTIQGCMDAMEIHDVCVASVPVKSTIKIAKPGNGGELLVDHTPDRDTLMEVQTPQCFRYGIIRECCEYAISQNVTATDDTALAEMLGYDVFLTKGSYSNIKITTPEDIPVAEEIIRQGCP